MFPVGHVRGGLCWGEGERDAALDATDNVEAAYRTFRRSGVRRLPALDGERLVVALTVDDLLLDVFQRLADSLGAAQGTDTGAAA
ncbi:hypothetical protein [Streptomyces sp. So13.3]|uniref:hypothetical protein n=1 Tax=Streptomyces sp. So13.3 TaxID=2136173 RepID=UPI00164D98E1|nr:hypothetical protein [Streptomyces sp. So13.3]